MFLFVCFCCARCSVSAGRAGLPADRLTSFCFITHLLGLSPLPGPVLDFFPEPPTWLVAGTALCSLPGAGHLLAPGGMVSSGSWAHVG